MDSIHIRGGYPLYGSVRVQGSKNAVLPILAATVLVEGKVTLCNCPRIADVLCMVKLLRSVGCHVEQEGSRITVDASCVSESSLPEHYVTQMRSSAIMMGAVLGRKGQVSISYPGGCVIGKRPIDMHLQAFSCLGASFAEEGAELTVWAERLRGSEIRLAFPSVGATENSILAAVLAEGETVIRNAAREPEIRALCEFLVCAGADIRREREGAQIRIRGVKKLSPCKYRIPFDRIVAGTYLLGAMAAGGRIRLTEADAGELTAVLSVIRQMGGICDWDGREIRLQAPERPKAIPYIRTAVYPGYPTDLQSQLLAVLALAEGESVVEETIFENRFRTVPELAKMGACIEVQQSCARINGVRELQGAHVEARELRGGAALCMAALAAKGDTYITGRRFIDRGYETLEQDIRSLGGRI